MDEKQQVAADIQDALASMMAVEPSPEFVARVRQRITADGDAREWRPVHLVLPALAVAVVVVVGVLLIFTGTRRIAPERLMPALATRHLEPAPRVSTPSSEPAAAAALRQDEQPAALVPRNEIVAIQRLLAAAQADRFEFDVVPAGLPVATELSPPGPISLPPIEMMPIGTSSSFE
jgi:hypothetical protein